MSFFSLYLFLEVTFISALDQYIVTARIFSDSPKVYLTPWLQRANFSEAFPWCSNNKAWMGLGFSQLRHHCHIIEACIDLLCTHGVRVKAVCDGAWGRPGELEGKFIPIHKLAKGRGNLTDFQQEMRNKAGRCVWAVSFKLQLWVLSCGELLLQNYPCIFYFSKYSIINTFVLTLSPKTELNQRLIHPNEGWKIYNFCPLS